MATSFRNYIKNIGDVGEKGLGEDNNEAGSKSLEKITKTKTTPKKLIYSLSEQATSDFANIFIINANREEVVIRFGVHQNWERSQESIQIDLNNRIILNPYVAKRLSIVLKNLIQEYENKYVDVNIEPLDQVRVQAASATKH